MVSRFVAVVEDDAGWGCVKVESPEEMIDRDAKVRDERIRSEAGLDVLMTTKFEFAEKETMPG